MRTLRLVLLFSALLSSTSPALERIPSSFKDIEQDGSGVIWAAGGANQLSAFDGQRWRTMPIQVAPKTIARPIVLRRMMDGAVACVWWWSGDGVLISRHFGSESQVFCQFSGRLNTGRGNPRLFADSQNRLWIIGQGPTIYRVGLNSAPFTYDIQPEQLLNPEKVRDGYNPLHAIEDGRGRIWVWSSMSGTNLVSLSGALIFDGDNVRHIEQLEGIKEKRFSLIARKDDRHMWVFAWGEGLFEVDIESLKAEKISEPEPHVFEQVQRVFVKGDDLFVIAEHVFEGTLWRLRTGRWTRMIEEADWDPDPDWPWLPIGDDLILSARPSPWYIPAAGPPVRLDWRNGFDLECPRKIFRLADGSIIALGENNTIFHRMISPKAEPEGRITELKFERRDWTMDLDSNVWAIPDDNDHALRQWNGEKWLRHELPSTIDTDAIGAVAADTHGRIWLNSCSTEPFGAFFDSRTGKWSTFPTSEDAFLAVVTDPPEFASTHSGFYPPQFSADHQRIAFRNKELQLAYFDGVKWTRWSRDEIAFPSEDNSLMGQPFFDENDKLCVTIKKNTWQLTEQGKWQKTKFVDRFPDDWGRIPPSDIKPPDGCVTGSPDSIVRDNLGTYWLLWQRRLYRCVPGACAEVFSANERHPFTTNRRLEEVFVDRHGNAFAKTRSAFLNWYMIAPKSSSPDTFVALERTGDDSVTVRLSTDCRSQARFRWKLDNESWQWTTEKTLTLLCSPGAHTLRASALDEDLQLDQTPAVARFEITIDPNKQIAALIAHLTDRDFVKREAAVVALARQPVIALPALRVARENANDDQLWWIDAAIQEIERRTGAK